MPDKTKIKTKLINGNKLYSKNCPWKVNYSEPKGSPNALQYIRKVGSRYCQQCDYFIKIENDMVICQ